MEIKIHVLHCGSVRVDESLPFAAKTLNPISYTGIFRSNKHQIWLPVSAYLIEHPKGLILIDTGWHTDVRNGDGGKKHMGFMHWLINKAYLPEGEAIDEQLVQLGYKPSDIDILLLSHMHSDHVSGLKLVKDAKKIMVSDLEWQETIDRPCRYVANMWTGVTIDKFSFSQTGIGPEGMSYDVFGDGTITMVYAPGHTMGLAATIIKNSNKFLLLTSDVGYAKKSWEHMILPGVQVDAKKVKTSLEWVKEISKDINCIEAIANHDSNIQPKVITL